MVLFLQGYGLSVGRLLELLLEMRDRYSEILSEQWVEVFSEIFAKDNYTPICCESAEEYMLILSQFPYQDQTLEEVRYLTDHMRVCCKPRGVLLLWYLSAILNVV